MIINDLVVYCIEISVIIDIILILIIDIF